MAIEIEMKIGENRKTDATESRVDQAKLII